MTWELVVALLLVAANGFFVAVEFSVARLRPTQVQELLRQRRPGACSAAHAIEHIDAYLSACQLGITMASLGLGMVGEHAFHHLLQPLLGEATTVAGIGLGAAIAFLIITTLHVVLGELSPKSLAIARTGTVVLALAPVMRLFYLSAKPLVDLLNGMGNLVLKPFGVPPASEAGHQPHSELELLELLRESSREGLIGREEERVSEAALLFGDMWARDAMPRTCCVSTTCTDLCRPSWHGPWRKFPSPPGWTTCCARCAETGPSCIGRRWGRTRGRSSHDGGHPRGACRRDRRRVRPEGDGTDETGDRCNPTSSPSRRPIAEASRGTEAPRQALTVRPRPNGIAPQRMNAGRDARLRQCPAASAVAPPAWTPAPRES